MNPLYVDERLWEQTLDLLQPYAKRGVEAGCFWYGLRGGGADHAVIVGIPHQVNRPRNFDIPADALADLVAAVPPGLVAVAQIHTHPGRGTTHSPWDDNMIVSRKVVSLVLPEYGRRPCPLEAVGVHTFIDQRWQRVDANATNPMVLYTSPVDTRS